MDDVAERSEVSKATLYNYFPGKDSLLMGIAEAELEQIREMIEGELAEEPSALERLRRVLEAFVLDSMCYISLSRKISYLNSCEDAACLPPGWRWSESSAGWSVRPRTPGSSAATWTRTTSPSWSWAST